MNDINSTWIYGKEDLFKIVEALTNANYIIKIEKETETSVERQAYLVTWINEESFAGQTFEVINWENFTIDYPDGKKEKFKFIGEENE